MIGKDVEQELSTQMGGWENLARELFKLCTDRGINCSDEILRCIEQSSAFNASTPVKRGAKKKRDLSWFFFVEEILRKEKAKNKWNSERFNIENNLKLICGKSIKANIYAQKAALKTIQNHLSGFRKQKNILLKARAQQPSSLSDLIDWSGAPIDYIDGSEDLRDYL